MGQKVMPLGFRIGIREPWRSRWLASKKDFPALLEQDHRIRRFIKAIKGPQRSVTPCIHRHMLDRDNSTPLRLKIFSKRFRGRWSPNLLTAICANRLGAAKHLGKPSSGLGAKTTCGFEPSRFSSNFAYR